MGGRLSLGALQSSPLFALSGVADLREDVRMALQKDFGGLATFSNHTEMFNTLQPDVVCVSTYAPTHEEVTLAALELPSLKGILTAIAGRGVPVVVPHGMVAKATPPEIIGRVQAGEIGRLVLVEIQCKGWDILNAGIHWLHFCRMLTPQDAPVSVHCAMDVSTKTYRDGLQVETAATTSIVHSSGLRVILHTGDETPINVAGKAFVFRLVGEKGTIEFWGWENGYLFNGELVTPKEFPTTGHRRHLENLAAQCHGAPHDNTIPTASLEALELCEAAYLSGNHGVQVALPLANFVPPDTKLDWVAGQPYSGVGGGRDGRQFG
jgi:predicted dehydrogenase